MTVTDTAPVAGTLNRNLLLQVENVDKYRTVEPLRGGSGHVRVTWKVSVLASCRSPPGDGRETSTNERPALPSPKPFPNQPEPLLIPAGSPIFAEDPQFATHFRDGVEFGRLNGVPRGIR